MHAPLPISPCTVLWLAVAWAILNQPTIAAAQSLETVITRDNRLYRGFVSETRNTVTVRWPGGDISLPLSDIARRTPIESPNDVYQRRLAKLMKSRPTAKQLMALADEARDAIGLTATIEILRQVIAIAPDHAEARQRLGFERRDGRWLTRRAARYRDLIEHEKAQEANGLVDYRGQWVTPAERQHLARGQVSHKGKWMAPTVRDALIVEEGEAFVLLGPEDRAAIVVPPPGKRRPGVRDSLPVAASDLAKYLEVLTGVAVPIVHSANHREARDRNLIRLDVAALHSDDVPEWCEDLPSRLRQDVLIAHQTSGKRNNLVLAGPTRRATSYAAWSFLQDIVGFRWYLPGDNNTVVPYRRRSLVLPVGLRIESHPAFPYLRAISPGYLKTYKDSDLRAERRNTAHLWGQRNRLATGLLEHHHSYKDVLPAKSYFAQYPEYFALLNGKRTAGSMNVQICTTNSAVIDIFVDRLPGMFGSNPAFAESISYPLAPNDMNGWCECANCRALDDAAFDPREMTRRIVTFTNTVAERVADRLQPEQLLTYYIYTSTLRAYEGVTLHEKILPLICRYLTTDYSNSIVNRLNRCGGMTDFAGLWETWAEATLGGKIAVYDYLGLPEIAASTLNHSADNLQFYRDKGAVGVFFGVQKPLDVVLIEAYVLAQLMWDPNLDPTVIRDDLLADLYGDQARLMRRHFVWESNLVGAQFGQTALIYGGAQRAGRIVDRGAATDWPDDVERALAQTTDDAVRDRVARVKTQKDVTIALIELFAGNEAFLASPTMARGKKIQQQLVKLETLLESPDGQRHYPRTQFLNAATGKVSTLR